MKWISVIIIYFLLSIFLQFVITIVKINFALWGSLETIIHSIFHAAGYKIVTESEQFFQPSSGWTFIIKEGTLYFIIFWMIAFACKAKFWCIAQPLADALLYLFLTWIFEHGQACIFKCLPYDRQKIFKKLSLDVI